MSGVIVVTRFDVSAGAAADFPAAAQAALQAFSACAGFVRGRLGRAADDPAQWLLSTEWTGVGAYRRSLSSYDVKVQAAPLLAQGRDEPSAFEVLLSFDEAVPPRTQVSRRARDAGSVALGEAAAPFVE